MRMTLFVTGIIVCLVGLRLSRSGPHGGQKEQVEHATQQRGGPRQTQGPSWTVTGGWQLKRALAIETALEEAATRVQDYLRELNPPVDWTPTTKYLRDHLLMDLQLPNQKGPIEAGEVATQQILIDESHWATEEQRLRKDPGGDARLYRVRLRVGVSPQELAEIRKLSDQEHVRQRKERIEQRMVPLARVLGALVVLLAAVAGYVRLDEWSKGYYRTWLRLAATGLVAAVWVGLSWPVLHVLVQSFLGE